MYQFPRLDQKIYQGARLEGQRLLSGLIEIKLKRHTKELSRGFAFRLEDALRMADRRCGFFRRRFFSDTTEESKAPDTFNCWLLRGNKFFAFMGTSEGKEVVIVEFRLRTDRYPAPVLKKAKEIEWELARHYPWVGNLRNEYWVRIVGEGGTLPQALNATLAAAHVPLLRSVA